MKYLLAIALLFLTSVVKAQELFVFTEPASNMAAKSIGLRARSMLLKNENTNSNTFQLIPEIMWGVSKKTMLHADAFLIAQDNKFSAIGGSMYIKYRFFSVDEVHSHFRIAAFGRLSFNNSPIKKYAIDLYGNNSGYEAGLVATKLITKVALSASTSFLHATDNGSEKFLFNNNYRNALNYTFSAGKLVLPKNYNNYKQVNVNMMIEFLGQLNLYNYYTYLDVAPSVQFIFNSRLRVDVGYRYRVVTTLQRSISNGLLLRVEYNLFNVY